MHVVDKNLSNDDDDDNNDDDDDDGDDCNYFSKGEGNNNDEDPTSSTFSAFKVARQAQKPLVKAAKYSKNPGVFCYEKHDNMSSFRLNNGFRFPEKKGLPTAGNNLQKRHFILRTWQNTPRFLDYFDSLF